MTDRRGTQSTARGKKSNDKKHKLLRDYLVSKPQVGVGQSIKIRGDERHEHLETIITAKSRLSKLNGSKN
jgi:hypothetical protein